MADISAQGRRISGEATVEAQGWPSTRVVLEGGFSKEDLLQLNYDSTDPKRKQDGVFMLRLYPDGVELDTSS
jgi:hypothetical protein